jgi:hypothetical protein
LVTVTEYDPVIATVMVLVVAPVLHKYDVAAATDKTLLQEEGVSVMVAEGNGFTFTTTDVREVDTSPLTRLRASA